MRLRAARGLSIAQLGERQGSAPTAVLEMDRDRPTSSRASLRRCARRLSGARRLRAIGAREAGDTLIEVIVGAMLVGLIISAVFTGLDVAGRASASERQHARADLLAQQD